MRRLTVFALAGLGIALTLTACSTHPVAPRAGMQGRTTVTAPVVPAATPTPSADSGAGNPYTAAPRHTNPPTLPRSSLANTSVTTRATGCPVTAETLLSALKADGARYTDAGKPAALEGATCYGRNALAHAIPDGVSQPSKALFAFDVARGTWAPIAVAGSGGFCRAYVSDDVIRGLGGC